MIITVDILNNAQRFFKMVAILWHIIKVPPHRAAVVVIARHVGMLVVEDRPIDLQFCLPGLLADKLLASFPFNWMKPKLGDAGDPRSGRGE